MSIDCSVNRPMHVKYTTSDTLITVSKSRQKFKLISLTLLNKVKGILNAKAFGYALSDIVDVNGAAGGLVATTGHPHKKMLAGYDC